VNGSFSFEVPGPLTIPVPIAFGWMLERVREKGLLSRLAAL
jgi:hypothetical protein